MLYKHPRDKKIAYYDPLELLWAILRLVTRVQKQRAPAFEHAMEQVLVSLGPPELPEVEDLLQLGLEPTAIVAWLSTVFDIFGDHGNSVLARSVREPKRKLTKAEQRAACDLLHSLYLIDATNPHRCACKVDEIQRLMKDGSGEKLGELGGGK